MRSIAKKLPCIFFDCGRPPSEGKGHSQTPLARPVGAVLYQPRNDFRAWMVSEDPTGAKPMLCVN